MPYAGPAVSFANFEIDVEIPVRQGPGQVQRCNQAERTFLYRERGTAISNPFDKMIQDEIQLLLVHAYGFRFAGTQLPRIVLLHQALRAFDAGAAENYIA